MSHERRERGGIRSLARVLGATAFTLVVGTLAAVGSGWDTVVPGVKGVAGDPAPGAAGPQACGEAAVRVLPAEDEAAPVPERVMIISTRAGVVRLEMPISGA